MKMMMMMMMTTIIVSLRNTTAERRGRQNACVCDKRDRPITYVFCGDLHSSECFLIFNKKTCLKEGEVRRKRFSNKVIVTLVTQGLPSSFLSKTVV